MSYTLIDLAKIVKYNQNVPTIQEKPSIDEIIHTLDNLRVLDTLKLKPDASLTELTNNPDTETMIALNEKVRKRRDFLIDIGDQVINSPSKIVYRASSRAEQYPDKNDGLHPQQLVIIGEYEGAPVEVGLTGTESEELRMALLELSPQFLKEVRGEGDGYPEYEQEITPNNKLLAALKNRTRGPYDDEISDYNKQMDPDEPGSMSFYGARAQQLEEKQNKDLGSGIVTIDWDKKHTEKVETSHRRLKMDYSPPGEHTPSEIIDQTEWKSVVRRTVNGTPKIDTLSVNTKPETMPHIYMKGQSGEVTEEYSRVGQVVIEEISFPRNEQQAVDRSGQTQRYYPQGGNTNGWVTESRYWAHCQPGSGWRVEAAQKYDYAKNTLDARATKSSDYGDKTPVITPEFIKKHLSIQQAGIVEGEDAVPNLDKLRRMVLKSIPE